MLRCHPVRNFDEAFASQKGSYVQYCTLRGPSVHHGLILGWKRLLTLLSNFPGFFL